MLELPAYTITEQLYQSANVSLFRGYRNTDSAPVVIKALRKEYPSTRDVARLRHEYTILQAVQGPGILKAYALERCGNGLALVMEDVGARPLSELIQSLKGNCEKVLALALSITTAIGDIHGRHVIHKDIKPHNILIDLKTDSAYIIDFGSATRLSQETQQLVDPGLLEGTLPYMSPEQSGRMNRTIDRRTDFYSFGVTLYEMLVGALPFDSENDFELIYSHIARHPRPPHARNAQIPRILSDLVMTLLAKNAEERYQSAYGLQADLRECLQQWREHRRVSTFALRQHDHSGELLIPQRLYGRETERAALLAAFERVRNGAAELLLVTGSPGVGKSALVHEIHKALARSSGYFIAGKFDQFSRSIPYAPIAQAVRGLLLQILSGSMDSLTKWKGQLQKELGSSGQLIIEVIPELELIIGKQPKLPTLGPIETQNRFELTFQRFIRVFASAEHPLVLFLDDLQWADPASLKLLQTLLTDPERRYMMIIGAYRDSEVSQAHLLTSALSALRQSGTAIFEMALKPLEPEHITKLVTATLGCGLEAATPLSKVLFNKTQGNPFFVSQFLTALHEEGLLRFDVQAGVWRWNLRAVEERQATDNVIELMAAKLRRLSRQAQETLTLAACLGHQFDLQSLSVVGGKQPAEMAAALWEPLSEGLLVPLNADYRLVFSENPQEVGVAAAQDLNASYRFLHDRVQQAAYGLADPSCRPALHLRIGRALLARQPQFEKLSGEQLIGLATHFNLAAELISATDERLQLVRLNLLSGQHSKGSSAYATAVDYFRAGAALVRPEDWKQEHALCFELHIEQAECEYLTGNFGKAEALFDLLLPAARTPLERAHLYQRRTMLYTTLGKNAEAVDIGRTALALLGIELPTDPEQVNAALFAEVSAVPRNLGERQLEEILAAPAIKEPLQKATMTLLMELVNPAFHINPMLNQLLCVKLVNLSLLHGNSDVSPFGYMSYGFFLGAALRQYEQAYRFGRFALELNERIGSSWLFCKLANLFAGFISFLRQPLRSGLPYLTRGIEVGLEAGDFAYVSYNAIQVSATRLSLGDELGSVREETERSLVLMQRTRDAVATKYLTVARQFCASLQGRTLSSSVLSDDKIDEKVLERQMAEQHLMGALHWYHQLKLQLLYLFEEYEAAFAMVAPAERLSAFAPGALFAIEGGFYCTLAAAALCRSDNHHAHSPYREVMARHKELVAALAASCPENFQHKLSLIEAEEARIEGRELEAMTLYDQAIEKARQGEFIHHVALASELAARFYLSRGRQKIASLYISDAHHAYTRWGATAKAAQLSDKYQGLLLQLSDVEGEGRSDTKSASLSMTLATRTLKGGFFDLATAMRAAQAISSEIVLERVLEQVLRIALSNAGAQRGFLLLQQDGQLLLEARITAEPDVVRHGLRIPLESCTEFPISVVQYVLRTGEPVVLADATRDPHYAGDPYVAAHRPRSILSLALQHQGRTSGVLYLENSEVRGAFTLDRLELLRLLCAQAASAVENALLYARVHAVTEQLRRVNHEQADANARMQALTAELQQSNQELNDANARMQMLTAELQQSNRDLSSTNERLQIELTERVRAERERAALQEEIIQVQNARLAEMSTPVIPITDQIMVMPLIGTVDSQRAQQVLEAALQAAQGNRAQVVIIDITGMKHVDTSAANSLINTASALRLLGASAVLTGIRAEVAQTLVGLGVELSSIMTLSNLQSGIAYALKRTGASLLSRR